MARNLRKMAAAGRVVDALLKASAAKGHRKTAGVTQQGAWRVSVADGRASNMSDMAEFMQNALTGADIHEYRLRVQRENAAEQKRPSCP